MKGLQFIFSLICLLFCLFSFSSSVVLADDKPSVRCEYYAEFVAYGNAWLPKGVSRLTKEQISKRYCHYRFEYEGDLLKRVVYSNSRGDAMSQSLEIYLSRDSIYEFHHSKEREYPFIIIKNEAGQFIRKETFLDEKYTTIDVFSVNELNLHFRLLYLYDLLNNPIGKAKSVKPEQLLNRCELERNDKGYVVLKRFYHAESGSKHPVADDKGRYGIRYQCDDLGRICREVYLDENGSNMLDDHGVAQRKIVYNELSFPIRIECYDLKGHLCLNDKDWAIQEMKQDDAGNAIYCAYRDANNQLCLSSDLFSVQRNKYDDFGFPVKAQFFNANDQPYIFKHGFFESRITYEGSTVTMVKYYGIDDEPIMFDSLCFGIMREFDQDEKTLSCSFLGKDGELMVPQGLGFAIVEMTYGDQGHMLEMSFWKGPLVSGEFCDVPRVVGKYDGMFDLVEITTLDTNGTLKTNDLGFSVMKIQYDSLGRTQSISVFDENDLPTAIHNGISSVIIRYDDQGQICEKITYDIDGNQLSSH